MANISVACHWPGRSPARQTGLV